MKINRISIVEQKGTNNKKKKKCYVCLLWTLNETIFLFALPWKWDLCVNLEDAEVKLKFPEP